MNKIRIAIVGVGNCASSLVQGLEYYRDKDPADAVGLMHWEIGGYRPQDIEVVAAFDIDGRKVGKDVSEAIFEPPNCTTVFCRDLPKTGVRVRLGRILDAARSRTPTQRDADKRLFLGTLDSSAARADFERHGWTSPINFDRISAFWEEVGGGD